MRAGTYSEVFAFLWRSLISISCFFDCFGIFRNRHHRQFIWDNNGEIAQESNVSSLITAEDKEECTFEVCEHLIQRVEQSDIEEELLEQAKFLKACGTLIEIPAEIRKMVCFAEKGEKLDLKESQVMINSSAEIPDEIQQAQASNLHENVERSDLCILPSVLKSSPETSEETSPEDSTKSDARRPCSVLRSSLRSGTLPETPTEIRKVVSFAEKVENSDIKESQTMLKYSTEIPDEIQHAQTENLHENDARSDFCILSSVLGFSPGTSEVSLVIEPSSEDSAKSDAQRPYIVLISSPRSVFSETVEELGINESQRSLQSSDKTSYEIQQAQAEKLENAEGSDLWVLACALNSLLETSEATEVTTGASSEDSAESDAQKPRSVLRSSPYPTPRRITEDMQTPGTVFATNMKDAAQGNLRIRSQYVYTVLNPIGNLDQQHQLKAEKFPDREGGEYLPEHESITPCSVVVVDSSGKENIGSVNLSSWLKPPLTNSGRTTGDGPIIGSMSMEWNEQEKTSCSSPSLLDVNGIPNSTSKYEEDQKIRSHATPFEERLERALSETTSAFLRKPIDGMPIVFEET